MPRVALTEQVIDRDGLTPTPVAADAVNGHEFENSRQAAFLMVDNQDATAVDVTIITSTTVDGNAVADKVVTVPATTRMYLGPYSNAAYGSGTNRRTVWIDLSKDTSLNLALLRLTNP